MKRLAIVLVMLAAVLPATTGAQTEKTLTDIADRVFGAMAIVSCDIETDSGKGILRGQAICVDASGVFLTLALSNVQRVEQISNLEIITPGIGGKKFKAKLMGIDGMTGMAFVRATQPNIWSAVQFTENVKLSPGQQVISVGLLPDETGNTPYLGVGYVSAVLHTPMELCYITGGALTSVGSPVFTADGTAVGLVGQQPFGNYQMNTQRGTMAVMLKGHEQTKYFTTTNEFFHVLKDKPTNGQRRKAPWMGVGKIQPVGQELAEVSGISGPCVMVEQIVPNHPAIKAGLEERDIIIAIDGKALSDFPSPQMIATNVERIIMRRKVGDQIKVTVRRAGEDVVKTLTLEAMPITATQAERYSSNQFGFITRQRVLLDQFTESLADTEGLIVVYVAPRSPADTSRLQPNDVITSVNDQPIRTAGTFRHIVEGLTEQDPLASLNLLVRRGDETQSITIRSSGL